jgi:hypothetical protein
MANSKFLIWESEYEEGYCVIKAPVGVEKAYQLDEGVSRIEGWSSDIVCKMNQEFPKDIQLVDNLYGAGLVVISKYIRELLISEQVKSVEYLPVTILNHKGRIASKDYFILNPLDVVDCIDVEKSAVEWNLIDTDLIDSCEKLVLKANLVEEHFDIFRPKFWPYLILIHSELTDKLFNAGFTGLYFRDPLEYTGI